MKRRNSRQDLDLDGRVNLVGPTDHDLVKYDDGDFGDDHDHDGVDDNHDQIMSNMMMVILVLTMICFARPTGTDVDQGKSNRKNSQGKFKGKIPVKMYYMDMKCIQSISPGLNVLSIYMYIYM